jgi:hypothetical protein
LLLEIDAEALSDIIEKSANSPHVIPSIKEDFLIAKQSKNLIHKNILSSVKIK